MKIIHHIQFNCCEPEKFDWSIIKNYYSHYKCIIDPIIKLIKAEKNKEKNKDYIIGLKASLICFATKLEINEKTKYNIDENSLHNSNSNGKCSVHNSNTILPIKENKNE